MKVRRGFKVLAAAAAAGSLLVGSAGGLAAAPLDPIWTDDPLPGPELPSHVLNEISDDAPRYVYSGCSGSELYLGVSDELTDIDQLRVYVRYRTTAGDRVERMSFDYRYGDFALKAPDALERSHPLSTKFYVEVYDGQGGVLIGLHLGADCTPSIEWHELVLGLAEASALEAAMTS